MSKTSSGNFFEDFRVGQEFRHATPRTLTEADAALNVGLYGSRFAINSSDEFARAIGLPRCLHNARDDADTMQVARRRLFHVGTPLRDEEEEPTDAPHPRHC